jgi:branched-chain amino acid transport system permease protein
MLQLAGFAQPMSAPSLNTIRIIDDVTVELCWDGAPSLNGNVFNEYQFYYSSDPAGNYVLVQTVTNASATSVTITGLPVVNGSRYFYAITRFNTAQLSVNSAVIRSIYLNVAQAPNGHMKLIWNKISNPAFPTTEGTYRVFRRILPAPGYTQISNSVTDTTYTDSTIWHPVCNETIFYRIEQGDNQGMCISVSNERESTFNVVAPDSPVLSAVTVTGLPPQQDVTLTWTISPSLDVQGYYIYQLNSSGSPVQVADVPGRLSITTTLNFAQGAMVFFAALTCVSLVNHWDFPLWVAILTTIATMAVLGVLIERIVLRPLVNQPEISLFMATIGLSFFIEGMAQLMWGAEVQRLDLGIEDVPMESLLTNFNIIVSKFDVVAACICAILVTCLALFFSRTKIGRALRAVADDHQAALAVGIPLQHIWGIVWAVAGFVAMVAGLLWGSRNGVQFSLTFVALKALPVLILGGFTSVPGAIIGGLIIGSTEKLAEVYLGPFVGGGIEGWFPYVLALLFLLVRPEGLFGEKIIRRI